MDLSANFHYIQKRVIKEGLEDALVAKENAEALNIVPIPSDEEWKALLAERDSLQQSFIESRENNTIDNQRILVEIQERIQKVCSHRIVENLHCKVCGEKAVASNGVFRSTQLREEYHNYLDKCESIIGRIESIAVFPRTEWTRAKLVKSGLEKLRTASSEKLLLKVKEKMELYARNAPHQDRRDCQCFLCCDEI